MFKTKSEKNPKNYFDAVEYRDLLEKLSGEKLTKEELKQNLVFILEQTKKFYENVKDPF